MSMPAERQSQAEQSIEPRVDRIVGEPPDTIRKLTSCAQKTAQQVAVASVASPSSLIRQRLRSLGRCFHAVDVHFYLMKIDRDGNGPVSLTYQSARGASRAKLEFADRFQFQLFSAPVQAALMNDAPVQLSAGGSGGGQLLRDILQRTGGVTYLLCPLQQQRGLRGAIGISLKVRGDSLSSEALALLKLNGQLLLNHVKRVRRIRRVRRDTRQWKSIADQACDFALRLSHELTIVETIPYGLGSQTPRLNGLRLKDVVVADFRDRIESEVANAVERQAVRTVDFLLAIDHRGPLWFRAHIEPETRKNGVVATVYLTDDNAEKLHAENIRDLTDKLVKANRMGLLGQMSTEFAHQLNQPLQAMLNYCNLLQRRVELGNQTAQNMTDGLTKIETSILHSADIIERIRDFVKYRTLRKADVAPAHLLDQALMLVTPSVRGVGGDLTGPDTTVDVMVNVDSTQTVHVLVNLMMNALEACRSDGQRRPHIELSVGDHSSSARIVIDVSDNGPGLPVDDPEVVFRKFYTDKNDGLGLGLAISREVCESQGGRLLAKNHTDRPGCTFSVEMRVANDDGQETTELQVVATDRLPAD